MRTELVVAAVLVAMMSTACATSSIRDDVRAVGTLSHRNLPEDALDEEVDPRTPAEVIALLREPITADRAARIAVIGNRELRAELREMGIVRGQLIEAARLPNPYVNFDIRRPNNSALPLQYDLTFEYNVTGLILAPMRERAEGAALEAARCHAAIAVLRTGFEARVAVYELAATTHRLVVATQTLDALAAARDTTRAIFAAGNVPEIDLASQEAAYESARVTVAEIELDVADHRERVNRILGLHGEHTTWELGEQLASVPDAVTIPADAERRVLTASLELHEMRAGMRALARRAGAADAEGWIPDVTVEAHYEQEELGSQVGGGARVGIPLFDRQRGPAVALEAQLDAAQERYLGKAIDLRADTRDARNHLLSAHARARQYQTLILPARRRVLAQAILQYNAMQLGVFQLLAARNELLRSEVAYTEALAAYWTARAALDGLLAGAPAAMMDGEGSSEMPMSSLTSEGGH